ncbi:hypothetical protein C8R45DRAFT_77057 [Mycena sanguinolenta]|nr:hypothetical protein C8R45DRAFT_77057 [Mycena sanguinolenta]
MTRSTATRSCAHLFLPPIMSTSPYTLLATSPRPQSPGTPTQAPTQASMPDVQMDLVEILRSGEDSRLRRYRPERNESLASHTVLFCGADSTSQEAEDWDERRPWIVEMLPETAPPPARKRQKRSNGCGTRIHARAVAERRWRALLDGASLDIVGLADDYFTLDMKRELLLGKERCGCVRSGVGCAVCGNPLGTLYTPCSRHTPSAHTSNFAGSHYTFLRAAVSPPLPAPTRRVSIPNDEFITARVDRESLQRRLREREELNQFRARVRAAQQPMSRPPPRNEPTRPEWERRIDEARQEALNSRAAFDAWADATIQRATATAALDVVDLSPLLRRSASPPEYAPPVAPREVSEEERRRDWQRGVINTATRPFGRDWPTITRTIERTTAPAEPLSRRAILEELRQASRTIERTTAAPEIPPRAVSDNEDENGAATVLDELRREVLAARALERAERAIAREPPDLPVLSRRLSLGDSLRWNSAGNPSAATPEMATVTRPEEEATASTRRRTFFER